MKKNLIFFFALILIAGLSNTLRAQYVVNFEGENEVKASYASGTVSLSGIDWNMTDVLIGDLDADWKNGLRSARLRGYGGSVMTMLENKSDGLGTLSFSYRRYGTDGQADWKVEYSTNNGSSWTQIGAVFTAPASNDVSTFSETVNVSGDVRIRIKRATETGTSNKRLNIDDIELTNYSGGGNIPPSITNIVRNPSGEINSSTSVSVSATITDSDGSISLAQVKWGTSAGTYPNVIVMTSTSGSTYTTTTNIPAQTSGTTVYFVVYAVDNAGGTKTSSQQSYLVYDPATTNLPYSENFTAGFGNVYTYSVSGEDRVWLHNPTEGFVSMNGHNTGVLEDDWLILPAFNKNLYTNVVLSFDTWKRYGSEDADNYFKLYYSTNYPGMGNPTSSSWTELSFAQPAEEQVWVSSGPVNLNNLSGNKIYIALRYHYNVNFYRLWQVDNIQITGSQSGSVPVKLSFASINNNQSPSVNMPFNVVVKAVDANNAAGNVTSNTTVKLQLQTGTGSLGGTLTAVIPSGSNAVEFANISYNKAEANVSLKASTTAGMTLEPAISQPFTVNAVATNLSFIGFPTYGQIGSPIASFTVEARLDNQLVDPNFNGAIALVKLSGNGNVTGTLTKNAVAGVATFNDIVFSDFGSYTLQATASGLSSATSPAIFIMGQPTIATSILPSYIVGNAPTNHRVPYVYRATISNLIPNKTYKYINQVVSSADAATVNGAGNIIFIGSSGNFYRSSSPSFTSPDGHAEFTSDTNGNYTGWFITEPTSNARFAPGSYVFMRIRINDGLGGTASASFLTTADSTLAIGMVETPDNLSGSGVYGKLFSEGKNFAVLYNNVNGTGRPLAATFIEDDGTSGGTAYSPFYQNLVDGQAASWGTIIPNTLPNGLRRVEIRQLSNGSVIQAETVTSSNGSWPYGTNTVNPTAGPNALLITKSPDFTANQTNVTPGGQVQFTDLTPGNPSAWSWVFEGGTPSASTQQNPLVTYNTAGEFDVKLTVTTPFGTHVVQKTEYITVTSLPTANFTANTTTPAVGSSVQFTNTSTGQITSWQWTFTGGTPASFNGQNPPAIQYNTAGTFDVKLVVSNANGSNTKLAPGYITAGYPPVANFVANENTTIAVGNTLSFTDQSTGNIDSWSWTFEGGFPNSSSAQNPSNIFYNNAGLFDVSLTVSNVFGSNTKLRPDYVNAGFAPVADFNAVFETFVDRVEYHFNDLSTNNPTSWNWIFAGGDPATSTQQNPDVTYTTDGIYNVSLTAQNIYGSGNVIKTGYVVINLTGLEEAVFVPGFTLAPNPASGLVNIGNLAQGDILRVFSLTGQLLDEIQCSADRHQLQLQAYPKGILLVQSININSGKIYSARIISQ